MFDSISISLQPHQEYPLLFAPTLQGIFTCREKKLWKKKTITQIFSHCSKRNRVVGTGGGGKVRQGLGVVGFENPISTQISSEIAKQSVCWCAYATILYYLIHIRVSSIYFCSYPLAPFQHSAYSTFLPLSGQESRPEDGSAVISIRRLVGRRRMALPTVTRSLRHEDAPNTDEDAARLQ